jgi:hypothetical protein
MLNQIKSNSFMGWAAIFTVLFLTPNTYFVYHNFSVFVSPWREIASLGVALIIASGIMIYTLRKNFRVAKYYTLFEVSISAYYYINTIGWDWGLIPALGFTLILPISVYYYSREYDSQEAIQKRFFEYGYDELLDLFKHEKKNSEYLHDHVTEAWDKANELQTECAHWISEHERAMTGWSTDIGIRDERISELVAQCEAYESHFNEMLQPCIDNQKLKIAHLERQLSEYYDDNKKLKQEIQVLNEKREQDEKNNSKTPIQQSIAALAPVEVTPETPVQPAKKKAPIKREKVRDQKNTE